MTAFKSACGSVIAAAREHPLHTGRIYCLETPYDLALVAHNSDDLSVFRIASRAEVEFLESLR